MVFFWAPGTFTVCPFTGASPSPTTSMNQNARYVLRTRPKKRAGTSTQGRVWVFLFFSYLHLPKLFSSKIDVSLFFSCLNYFFHTRSSHLLWPRSGLIQCLPSKSHQFTKCWYWCPPHNSGLGSYYCGNLWRWCDQMSACLSTSFYSLAQAGAIALHCVSCYWQCLATNRHVLVHILYLSQTLLFAFPTFAGDVHHPSSPHIRAELASFSRQSTSTSANTQTSRGYRPSTSCRTLFT